MQQAQGRSFQRHVVVEVGHDGLASRVQFGGGQQREDLDLVGIQRQGPHGRPEEIVRVP